MSTSFVSLGPWLTFEVQLAQDDFNLLAWVFGESVPESKLPALRDAYHFKGLPSPESLLEGKGHH